MTRVVLLTSDELRHRFVRAALAAHDQVDLVCTYAEPHALSPTGGQQSHPTPSEAEQRHLATRARVEHDFFGAAVALCTVSSPLRPIDRGEVNEDHLVRSILGHQPDVLATFGCSIIGPRLIAELPRRAVNLHLGLSPYYRGSGTNLWPLVDGRPELVGATFLHLDEGIDTGEIIHQIRARVYPGDSPHHIGNRLIADAATVFPEVLRAVEGLPPADPVAPSTPGRTYRRCEVDEASIQRLEAHFSAGLVERYLAEQAQRILAAPIVEHPMVASVPASP